MTGKIYHCLLVCLIDGGVGVDHVVTANEVISKRRLFGEIKNIWRLRIFSVIRVKIY